MRVWDHQFIGILLNLQSFLRCLVGAIDEAFKLRRVNGRQHLLTPQPKVVPSQLLSDRDGQGCRNRSGRTYHDRSETRVVDWLCTM
jgi:hypothetical protein